MKTFLKIFLVLFILLAIGLGVFLWTFDLNTYRGFIENKISSAIGRTVKIGTLEMKLSLIPTIKVRDIQVLGNHSVFSDKPLAKVDSGEVTLSLVPLFSKRLEIQNIALNTMNVNLISKSGRKNWHAVKEEPKDVHRGEGITDVRLDSLSVSLLNISYQDNEKIYSYTGKNFSLKQMKVFSLNADIDSIPFKISGTVDSLWDFILEKPDYLFNIEFDGVGSVIKLSGSIGNTRTFKDLLLNADISGKSLKGTLEALGVTGKNYPAQPFKVSAVMQGDTSELAVSSAEFSLGNNKMNGYFSGLLSGLKKNPSVSLAGNIVLSDMTFSHFWGLNPFEANVDFVLNQEGVTLNNLILRANRTDLQILGRVKKVNEKIKADLRISSEYFDTQDVFFSEEMFYVAELDPYRQNGKGMLIDDKPVNLEVLKNLNAVVAIQMPHLKVSDKLRGYLGINSTVVLQNGVLSVNPLTVTLLGSKAIGSLKVSAVDNTYHLTLAGEDFQLNDIRSFAKILRNGMADVSLDLTGQGNTVKSLLSTLNGQVLLDVSQGVIVSDWFNGVAEKLNEQKRFSVSRSTADRESKILCAVLKADIKDGQITSQNNIAIETSTVNFMIGGKVNLVDETVDLTMVPSLDMVDQKLGNILKTLGRFVKISGTFANLKPTLSFDNALQNVMGLFDNKPYQEYQLCQQVLGRPTKAQHLKTAKQMQVLPITPKPQVVQEQPKDNSFKQLLMDSLEEALQ